jgi:heat shock protein HtpX
MLFGHWLGGSSGVIFAFIMALVMNAGAYFFSAKMVLAMYSAQPLDRVKYSKIYAMVEELTFKAGIPMPQLWYIPSPMANAFAIGRNPQHSHVAVTQGILDILHDHELRGVLAHEISHIKNRDILVATVAATIAMAIGYLANMVQWAFIFGGSHRDRDGNRSVGLGALIVALIMPFAATLIQLAISRSREFLADESGAHTCDDPLALASALEKLHDSSRRQQAQPQSNADTATASLFIVYPFSGKGLVNLFSTHPPMEERIRRLHKMARK